jgi:glycerol-3-phosphate dehydrogenase (NAD(P)+)
MKFSAGIIGAGAWGTALAQTIALSDQSAHLWCYEEFICKDINKNKKNKYLPEIDIAETVLATHSLKDIVDQNKILFLAMPTQYYTEILSQINSYVTDGHYLIICSKGFRPSDGALLSDVIEEVLTHKPQIGVLSGPAFAKDLATGKPCMLTISSTDETLIQKVSDTLKYEKLRIYHNNDIVGSQIGAALKNIIAIAAGISDALMLGESVRAAIICRGLKEIERFACAYGAKPETIYGLAGLGDSVLTASSRTSRNYDFGYFLGQGFSAQDAIKKINGYIEGLNTTRIVTTKALSQGIDLAIFAALDGVIQGDIKAKNVIEILMQRPRTHESD